MELAIYHLRERRSELPSLQRLTAARFDRLAPSGQRIMKLIAAVERPLPLSILAAAHGGPGVGDAIDALRTAHMVRIFAVHDSYAVGPSVDAISAIVRERIPVSELADLRSPLLGAPALPPR